MLACSTEPTARKRDPTDRGNLLTTSYAQHDGKSCYRCSCAFAAAVVTCALLPLHRRSGLCQGCYNRVFHHHPDTLDHSLRDAAACWKSCCSDHHLGPAVVLLETTTGATGMHKHRYRFSLPFLFYCRVPHTIFKGSPATRGRLCSKKLRAHVAVPLVTVHNVQRGVLQHTQRPPNSLSQEPPPLLNFGGFETLIHVLHCPTGLGPAGRAHAQNWPPWLGCPLFFTVRNTQASPWPLHLGASMRLAMRCHAARVSCSCACSARWTSSSTAAG